MVMLSNCILKMYVYACRFANLSARVREAYFGNRQWLKERLITGQSAKGKQHRVFSCEWIIFINLPLSKAAEGTWRCNRKNVRVCGWKESWEILTAGHVIKSQELWLSGSDLYKIKPVVTLAWMGEGPWRDIDHRNYSQLLAAEERDFEDAALGRLMMPQWTATQLRE